MEPLLEVIPKVEEIVEGNSHAHSGNGHALHAKRDNGFRWQRLFGDGNPYDQITWEQRTAKITKGDGTVVFEQKDIEVPSFWTQTATDIVASKYFRGQLNTPARETSVRQMIDRVAVTIGKWGLKDGYFATKEDTQNYIHDLRWILVNQYAAFNSPVWFNVGVHERPQCSACFILAVEDNMQSILDWYRDEGWIFKYGSGSGINLSNLRSSKEPLSRGGYSSGPVSFMKGADGVANSIRSGGTTRRAAKMVVLNVDHPDVKEFIYSKKIIENMVRAIEASGVKNSIEGDIFDPYTLLPYQNANNSVRVTDNFMRAVEMDEMWDLKSVTKGDVLSRVRARDILDWCADAAWHSADPGMQYDTTINDWHTCPNTGRINASNPCSEYMHLDNSACNLASINLLKLLKEDGPASSAGAGKFDVDLYKKIVDVMILAQDIVVDNSSYPTPKIDANAKAYRELGLGYANLGALLMAMGLPYDSDQGRIVAGQLTSLMCGEAYRMSALVADIKGPFSGFANNREPMLNVVNKHLDAAEQLYIEAQGTEDKYLQIASRLVWHEALDLGKRYGVRNSQVTVLAPTGTISFLMDCDTTGIEPALALISYKKLVGGGVLKLVNNRVNAALAHLGYGAPEIEAIAAYLLDKEMIEGAPYLRPEHMAVFDCSFKAAGSQRAIGYMGHVKMMAAAQPFISGAISKTINLPSDATKEDVKNVFIEGWRLGLKAIAVYRDGSKSIQPLNVSKDDDKKAEAVGAVAVPAPIEDNNPLIEKINGYRRYRLPDERPSITHKFFVGGYEGYLTIGFYPDTKKPGETFLVAAKEGSTVSGLLDTVATLTSMCLQSGIPLKLLVKKFKDMRFDPAGFTNNSDIPMAKSIIDYMFRYMGLKFLSPEDREEIFGPDYAAMQETEIKNKAESMTLGTPPELAPENIPGPEQPKLVLASQQDYFGNGRVATPVVARVVTTNADAPVCNSCGTLMFKAGSCYSCPNCFATTGVCN